MRLLRSLAVVLAAACTAGCFGSDSKTYSATELAESLFDHGFIMSQPLLPTQAGQEEGIPRVLPSGVRNVVFARKWVAHSTPAGYVPEVVLVALVFDRRDEVSCADWNSIGTCLRKWNVAVAVRTSREEAAREALDDLD